jgi:hypothetical protein
MIGNACIKFECPIECGHKVIEFGKCKSLQNKLCGKGKFRQNV